MDRPRKNLGTDSRIDYALILPVFLLSLIGFVALSLSLFADYPSQASNMLWQQAAWLLVGMAAAFFVMHLDSKMLWNLAPILYVVGLLLMLLPVFFYSPSLYAQTGAKNWIAFGTTPLFQPSELMKVAYTLFLARLIVNYRSKIKQRTLLNDGDLILRMFLATLPIIVILLGLQNDFGTLLVFLAIFAGMLLVSGISWRILAPVILVFGLLLALLVFFVISPQGQQVLHALGFKAYQSARFEAWLHPFSDPQGTTYQQAQALISTGIGGIFGTGTKVTNIAVPVRESDMIFTVIGGGAGFIGAAIVILLYLFLIYRMVRATSKAKNSFYVYIAAGLTMMLLFHVFENIGATIGILPLTGIPLPFISQGGSNLISNMIGIGLMLSIQYNKMPMFNNKKTRDKYRKKLAQRIEKQSSR